MSVIKLETAQKRPDLKVEYDGKVYVLPGKISGAMVEKMIASQKDGGDEAFLAVFLSDVVPADFKSAIAQDDLGPLAKIWLEHIQGPKDSGSTV
jgi:hypothetical protein